MLQDHSNLYADVSGLGMVAVLNRDRGYTEAFLTRHADRILFGSDEGWWSFGKGRWDTLTLELFEQLNLPPDVRHKIYRGNAERLFGLSGD
jgi:predicted TIM-barrel fold metal-dependent hydrolase